MRTGTVKKQQKEVQQMMLKAILNYHLSWIIQGQEKVPVHSLVKTDPRSDNIHTYLKSCGSANNLILQTTLDYYTNVKHQQQKKFQIRIPSDMNFQKVSFVLQRQLEKLM